MGIKLELQFMVPGEGLPSEAMFRHWAEAALAGHRASAELLIRVVDEEESAALNRQYRSLEGPTNVLSFPFCPPPPVESDLLGDLVICAAVVRRQAREQEKEASAHWAHMVVHGVLHLLGYDHQNAREAAGMEAVEVGVMARLGFSDPYRIEEK